MSSVWAQTFLPLTTVEDILVGDHRDLLAVFELSNCAGYVRI